MQGHEEHEEAQRTQRNSEAPTQVLASCSLCNPSGLRDHAFVQSKELYTRRCLSMCVRKSHSCGGLLVKNTDNGGKICHMDCLLFIVDV